MCVSVCVCNNKIKVWVEIMLKKKNKTKPVHAHDLKPLRGPKEYNIWSHLIKKKMKKGIMRCFHVKSFNLKLGFLIFKL